MRHWHGSFIVDISSTFEQKLAAMACYESQFDAARFEKLRHFLGATNAHLGGRCGFNYGEMFALPVPVGADDLAKLVQGGKGSPAPVQLPGKDHLPMG
jgi:LmbE family N-acetylglucosaminyl deacetylase